MTDFDLVIRIKTDSCDLLWEIRREDTDIGSLTNLLFIRVHISGVVQGRLEIRFQIDFEQGKV